MAPRTTRTAVARGRMAADERGIFKGETIDIVRRQGVIVAGADGREFETAVGLGAHQSDEETAVQGSLVRQQRDGGRLWALRLAAHTPRQRLCVTRWAATGGEIDLLAEASWMARVMDVE